VDAQSVSSADGANLLALVQSSSNTDEDSDELGALAPQLTKVKVVVLSKC